MLKDLQVWTYYIEKYNPKLKEWLLGISRGCGNKGYAVSYTDLVALMVVPQELWARPQMDYPAETGVTALAIEALIDARPLFDEEKQKAVDAAIARTEKVNPELNGLAYEAFDRARDQARASYGGFFDGVPSFIKDNADIAGMPTMEGSDAWDPRPKVTDGPFSRTFLSTGLKLS